MREGTLIVLMDFLPAPLGVLFFSRIRNYMLFDLFKGVGDVSLGIYQLTQTINV